MQYLHLQNISLDFAPELPLQKLLHLNLAFNELPNIPQQFSENLTQVRMLDLSYNDLTIVPEMVKYLPQLRSLSLAGNPITILSNASLGGIVVELEELNLANLALNDFELGALSPLPYLRTLHLSSYPEVPIFSVPKLIEGSENLRTLVLHGPHSKADSLMPLSIGSTMMDLISGPSTSARFGTVPASDFKKELEGPYPVKVRELKFTGASLNRIGDSVLSGIRSPALKLSISNTSLTFVPDNVFQNLDFVRNISIDFGNVNPKLGKIPNPNTANYPDEPGVTYLNEIEVAGMELNCNCDLG